MPSPFDPIKKKLAGKPTAAVLASALDDLVKLKDKIQGQYADLAKQRSVTLLTADEGSLAKGREAMATISDQLEIAAAIRSKIVADQAAALASEENARRLLIYDAASEKVTAAVTFGKRYAAAARAMAEAMAVLLEGQVAAAAANTALPEGCEALGDPEYAFTIVQAGAPKQIVHEETCEVWCRQGTFSPVSGRVEVDRQHPATGTSNGFPVDRRTFLRRECLPEVPAVYADRVAPGLQIPGYIKPPIVGWEGAFDSASYLATIRETLANFDAAPPAPVKCRASLEMVPVSAHGEVEESRAVHGAAALTNAGFADEHLAFKTKAAAE